MSGTSNAQRLRQWLLGCGALDASKRFGVDYLGDAPTEYALFTVPSGLKWTENIVGQRRLAGEQSQRFIFAIRANYGADVAGNLQNLAFLQAVTDWIMDSCAEGDFPEWEGGVVTGVFPTLTGAPVAWENGAGRYQIEINVTYRVAGG